MSRIRAHPYVPPGNFFVIADMFVHHPETMDPALWGDLDGSILLCNPADRERVESMVAVLGEHWDVNEALTLLRKRRVAR